MMKRLIPVLALSGLAWAAGAGAAGAAGGLPNTTLDVPIGHYTVLHFAQPVVKAVLPPDAPLKGKPYYLSHNTVLLLNFEPSKHPVQAIVELADGSTHILSLQPKRGANAQISVPGTAAHRSAHVLALPPVPPSRNPAAGVVPVLSALVSGKVPSGWSPQYPDGIPRLRYDRLTAIPVAAWDGGSDRVVQYRVKANGKQASVVDPSQFYLPGVKAAMLDSSKVYPGHPVTLYVMTTGQSEHGGR